MADDQSEFVRKKIKNYSLAEVKFTKVKLLDWLAKRNKDSIENMKKEVLSLKTMVFAERQVREHKGKYRERFACYLTYSNTRGRRYVLEFDKGLKIITVHPLGRMTLTRYRKRFK